MAKIILLADDSITIQKVVELTFSDGDYEVIATNNGAKAIQRLSEVRPDIVLSDIIMPEKNGYEVCEYIKSHPEFRNTPVILLTGTFEPFDPDRAEKAGCDAVVTKPFESQSLIQKVEDLIAQSQSRATSFEAPPAAPPAADPFAAPDQDQAAEETQAWPVRSFAFGADPAPPVEEPPLLSEDAPFSSPPPFEPDQSPQVADEASAPDWPQPFDEPPAYAEPFSSTAADDREPEQVPFISHDEPEAFAAPEEPAPPQVPFIDLRESESFSDSAAAQPATYGADLFLHREEEPPQDLPFEEQPSDEFATRAYPQLSLDELVGAPSAEQPPQVVSDPPASFELDDAEAFATGVPAEEAPADFAGVEPEEIADYPVASEAEARAPSMFEPEAGQDSEQQPSPFEPEAELNAEQQPESIEAEMRFDEPAQLESEPLPPIAEEGFRPIDGLPQHDRWTPEAVSEPAEVVDTQAIEETIEEPVVEAPEELMLEAEEERAPAFAAEAIEEVAEVGDAAEETPEFSLRTERPWAPSDVSAGVPLTLGDMAEESVAFEPAAEAGAIADEETSSTMYAADGSELLQGNPDALAWSPGSPESINPAPTPVVGRAEVVSSPAAAPVDLSALTDDQVDRIARRVVELISDQAVRSIAWEVIPDMAAMIVKERIRELEDEV